MNIELQIASRSDGWAWARASADTIARSRPGGRAVLDALDYFEALLGADWTGWAERRPLANTFFTGVSNDEVAGVELHRLLAVLDNDPEIREVIGQLQSAPWEQFVAATMVIHLAARARTAGIKTKFLRARGKTIADLLLDICGRWLTIECLALHETAVMRLAEDVDVALSHWLRASGIDRLGRTMVTVLNERSPSEVMQRLPELKAAVQTLACDGGPSDAEIEGLAKISFERGLSPHPVPVSGLGSETLDRDIHRLRQRMRQKSRQLVADGPSILVVRSRHLFAFDHHREEMLARTLEMLDEELGRLKDIGAVIVYETWLGSPRSTGSRRDGGFAILEGAEQGGRARVAAFVANANAAHPLSDAELEAFIGKNAFW